MSEQNANIPSDNDPRVPELPDVDLLRQIGQGGFGQVWLATNRTTGQLCAVKVSRPIVSGCRRSPTR
jgi:serine/threonine protein kinase